VSFIDDMAEAYQWADLVICRSGALTISELAAIGVASILVPLPIAVDDHQTHNGRYLAQVGAAEIIQQRDLNPQYLAGRLADLLTQPNKLAKMAAAARGQAKLAATTDVVKQCLEVAHG